MADLQSRSPADFLKEEQSSQSSIANHMIDRHDTPVRLATAMLYSVGLCLLIILVWAAVTNVPEVAVAPGQIIPRASVKLIEPSSDGVIEKIYVKEGQQVKNGDKLVMLDRVPYQAELDKARRELEIAKSKLIEHDKAIQALTLIIQDPSKMPDLQVDVDNVSQIISDLYNNHETWVEAQKDVQDRSSASKSTSPSLPNSSDMSLITNRLQNAGQDKIAAAQTLEKRKREFAERKKALAIEVSSLQKQVKTLKEKRENLELILTQTKTQAEEMRVALMAGGLSRLQYLDSLKSVETQEMALMEHDGAVDKLEHQLAAAISAQAEFENKSRADEAQLQSNINKASSQVSEVSMQERERHRNMSRAESTYFASLAKARAALSQETDEKLQQESRVSSTEASLRAAQNKFERAEICSPIDGIVTAIKLRGRGEVVSQKDVLMSVVPLVADLVVEAQLPNKERGFVAVGQPVKLKLDSFPFQEFGILQGKVIEVEAFPREISKLGGYYRVLVEPEQQYMQVHGKQVPFASGMTVSAEIITRFRTILNIMLEPIKNLQDSRWN